MWYILQTLKNKTQFTTTRAITRVIRELENKASQNSCNTGSMRVQYTHATDAKGVKWGEDREVKKEDGEG